MPYQLDLETTNRLFNPVEWQRAVDGSLIKIESGNEVGPGAVMMARITPLYFILTLDSVQTNEFGVRYIMGVERQAAPVAWQRAKRQHYASLGEKNEAFTITAVQGPPADPTQLILQLTDSGETVSLSKTKPFRRVDAYMADLKYGPEGKSWDGQRVGDDLKFCGRRLHYRCHKPERGGIIRQIKPEKDNVDLQFEMTRAEYPSQRSATLTLTNLNSSMTKAVSVPLGFFFILAGTLLSPAQTNNAADLAVSEAVLRQANTVVLRQKLVEAKDAAARGDLAVAARLYEDAYSLVQQIGSGIDAESAQTISGLVSVRLELAREAQRKGDFREADTQINRVLKVDPQNPAALAFKKQNDQMIAAMRGQVPDDATVQQAPSHRQR